MSTEHTFLYVEDDPLGRDAIELVLRRVMKIERLYLFEDSRNFLGRLAALPERPNVILLDIHMQPLSGFDMLKLLRAEPAYQDATILALTASVMNEEVELLKRSGFNGVIGKPISVTTFPGLIGRALAGEAIWAITE